MERPPAPPEAVLIRLAREAAGIRMADAARNAGVSVARWSQIETGSEMRHGAVSPVSGRAGTIARMAAEVGVSPERLEAEGQRPDAAEILREILRSKPSSVTAAGSAALPPLAVAGSAESAVVTDAAEAMETALVIAAISPRLEREIRDEIRRHPEGTPASVIFRDPIEAALFERDAPESQRIRWIAALRSVDARPSRQARQAGLAAGLTG